MPRPSGLGPWTFLGHDALRHWTFLPRRARAAAAVPCRAENKKKGPDETSPSGLGDLTHARAAHAALGMGVVSDSGEVRCRPLLRLLLMM